MIKLLKPDLTSCNGCHWVIGEWKETSGEGDLCGPGWLHGYDSAELAVLLNPIHANILTPVGYWIEVGGQRKEDGGLKFGVTRMRIIEPVVLPVYTIEQRIRFAIRCAAEVYHDSTFLSWANGWLTHQDQSASAAGTDAEAVERAAAWASAWAAWSAERAATQAARDAAEAAAWAAGAAKAVAGTAVWDAEAVAQAAAWAAAWAARAAALTAAQAARDAAEAVARTAARTAVEADAWTAEVAARTAERAAALRRLPLTDYAKWALTDQTELS